MAWSGAWHWRLGRWQLGRFSGRYQYVKATNVSVYTAEQGVLNKQLAYTPNHTGAIGVHVRRGSFTGAYLHQFTEPRFATTDNLEILRGFQTGNLILRFGFAGLSKKLTGLTLGVRVENAWNTPYQALLYRPMPGRGWRVECSYNW